MMRRAVLVQAIDAVRADAGDQPFVGLAHMEILGDAEVGLAEHRRALFADVARDPVASGGIAVDVDEFAAAFHEHRSAPHADVAAERRAGIDLLVRRR